VGRAETNAPGEVFVRRSPPGNIVRVKNSLASALRQPLAAFRDRRLLPGIAGTTRLEVRDGTNRFALEREGTNWFVASGVRRPADAVWVRETLRRMVALQIAEFVNDLATDPVRYGLAEPAREYVFTGPGASSNEVRTVAALAFGTPYAEGQRVYVRRSDEPGVYGLPMADFVVLPRSPAQFRDWKIDPTNVVRVEIRHRGATRVLLRDAAGRWQGRGMPPGALTDPAIDEGLYRLGQSAAGRFPAPDGAALKQFGFELVDHAVTVIQREGGPFRTLELRFGGRPNAVNQFVLARFDDEETPVLTEFPLRLYQEFVGPWFGIAPPAGPDVRRP
jgi:hypothetical protein